MYGYVRTLYVRTRTSKKLSFRMLSVPNPYVHCTYICPLGSCGIHQSGVLSLVKYLVFIDEVLVKLEQSNLCCVIENVPSSPAGYADDLAMATVSKMLTDMVHDMLKDYGKKWRFKFNASKSAVMVFGEGKKDNLSNSKFRTFRLGKEAVKEKLTYDHVGVKMRIFQDNTTRVEEKISKGRKTLNA